MNLTISPIAMTYSKMASSNKNQNTNNIYFTSTNSSKTSSKDTELKNLKIENARLLKENEELKNQVINLKATNDKLTKKNTEAINVLREIYEARNNTIKNLININVDYSIKCRKDLRKEIITHITSYYNNHDKYFYREYLNRQIANNDDIIYNIGLIENSEPTACLMAKTRLKKAGITLNKDKREFIFNTITDALTTSPKIREDLNDEIRVEYMKANTLELLQEANIEPKSGSLEKDVDVIFDNTQKFYHYLEEGINILKAEYPGCEIKERIKEEDFLKSAIGVKPVNKKRTQYYPMIDIVDGAKYHEEYILGLQDKS